LSLLSKKEITLLKCQEHPNFVSDVERPFFFAERAVDEGREWHQICLAKDQKEKSGVHNKGWYGTTPQDASVVNQIMYQDQIDGACSQCSKPMQRNGKFCSFCGARQ